MEPPESSDETKKSNKTTGSKCKSDNDGEKRMKTHPKDIFNAAAITDFTKDTEAQRFEICYKEKWKKKPANQILLFLAKKDDWPDGVEWSDEKTIQFLNLMLKDQHSLLEVQTEKYMKMPPFHVALMQNHRAFINAVLKFPNLINIAKVLQEIGPRGNALHIAVQHSLSSVELLVKRCAQYPMMFEQKDLLTGNTPLHMCMSLDLILEERDSESDESHEEKGSVISEDETNKVEHDRKIQDIGISASHSIECHLRHIIPSRTQTNHTSTSKIVQVVKKFIESYQPVLWSYNLEDRTPYQERIHQLREAISKNERSSMEGGMEEAAILEQTLREVISEDPIASYIRSYCVRKFRRDTIMKCLYKTGQELHIEFDLGGLPYDKITQDYLNQLSKHLRFESILKYVALPKLTIEESSEEKRGRNKELHRRGRSDLVTVFKWLRTDHKVQKIIKVIVLDDQDPCHSDSSIELALKGFGVEIWDWKRLDLSTEVIKNSTNVVKEVSLYSSGNNAVLMGWASFQGLPNREKFPEGYEDINRLMKYINTFTATVWSLSDERLTVEYTLDNGAISHTSGFQTNGGYPQPENPWIDCVEKFSQFLENIAESRNIQPVKVAIIDDGVDASMAILHDKIEMGKSFSPYANSADLMTPYFVSSSNHGTCMAMLICRLCPMVKLYVARLDQRYTRETNQRHITAKSAAEAIQWATDCGVDIISMSWTIETPITGNADMESLKAAVKAAESRNILMFCSTSDQGSLTKDYCYPGDFGGCIKIGSATNTGDAMTWVNIEKVDFLFPGMNVPFLNNEGKTVSHESGSSVATAAASGLAALLMFSSWVLDEEDKHFKDYKNMTVAFQNLSLENKFPRVHERLEKRFKESLARAEDAKSQKIYKLANLTWNDNVRIALEQVVLRIKETN